jgi:hypothetical protein
MWGLRGASAVSTRVSSTGPLLPVQQLCFEYDTPLDESAISQLAAPGV